MVVYVIYKGGNKLTISKTINRVNSNVGYPTFQFRVRQTADYNGTPVAPENAEEYVVSMSFTSSGTMTSELTKLPLGTYEITELSNISYAFSDVYISPAEDGVTEGAAAVVTIGSRSETTVFFNNSFNNREKKVYQTFADNHISYTNP